MRRTRWSPCLAFAVGLALSAAPAFAIEVTHLFDLANFSGTIPLNDVRLAVDRGHREIYVADGSTVRVFNESGMETFRFDTDPALGRVVDLAVDGSGNILLLALDPAAPADAPRWFVRRCNYRGDAAARIAPRGLPPALSGFVPNTLAVAGDRLVLVSEAQLRAVYLGADGAYDHDIDLGASMEIPDKDRDATEIGGVGLDGDGNLLLTVPVMFRVFVIAPDGRALGQFGKVGSAPGLFGVVAGVAADDAGRYYVTDRLRSAVMVFDREFRFLTEFGYPGDRPGNLVRPGAVAIGGDGRVFVTQLRNRGVSVFSVTPR